MKEIVLDILEDLTGTDEVREDLSLDLFEEGLLDSLAVVQFLVDIEEKTGKPMLVTEFHKEEWATPQTIIDKVVAFQ
ncbi:D-alanine--poly(phosphoribitol) ligase subunit DltC [Vagococcus coleopterorum]|uniref:D-alanyl carrier protein n=1 Tax=Vagococcus coleopterorum TaxID=2714946 RepID=A0A6G8APV5_9ENTE|nr:D-alanine--poly(phosphoribitol) ligase subunit DltC [Vagococcus coleopterorum]